MKRRDLIKALENMGCILVRNGGRHDWYTNPQTKQSQPVPRQRNQWKSGKIHNQKTRKFLTQLQRASLLGGGQIVCLNGRLGPKDHVLSKVVTIFGIGQQVDAALQ